MGIWSHMFARRAGGVSALTVVWLLVGAFVAGAHDYFDRIGTIRGILSALLAIVLWPLVLLGVDLNIGR